MLKLSFSKIDSYLRCPLAFRFKYEDGIEPEEKSPALAFGSAVHSTIGFFYRRLMEGQCLTEEQLRTAFIEDWIVQQVVPIKFNGKSPEEFEAQGLELVKMYVGGIGDNVTVPVAVEEELRSPLINLLTGEILEGVEIHGFLDRINPDGTPVEMKTSSRSWNQFQADSSLQMSIYSYLLTQCDGRREVRGMFEVITKTKSPKLQRLETVRNVKSFDQMYRTIEQVAHGIKERIFFPNRGFGCAGCDYCSECAAW